MIEKERAEKHQINYEVLEMMPQKPMSAYLNFSFQLYGVHWGDLLRAEQNNCHSKWMNMSDKQKKRRRYLADEYMKIYDNDVAKWMNQFSIPKRSLSIYQKQCSKMKQKKPLIQGMINSQADQGEVQLGNNQELQRCSLQYNSECHQSQLNTHQIKTQVCQNIQQIKEGFQKYQMRKRNKTQKIPIEKTQRKRKEKRLNLQFNQNKTQKMTIDDFQFMKKLMMISSAGKNFTINISGQLKISIDSK